MTAISLDVLANLGDLAANARMVRGLSLREAADEIGIGYNTLYRLEQGGDIVLSNAVQVARWVLEDQ